jgi:hypothetical protein
VVGSAVVPEVSVDSCDRLIPIGMA